MASRAQYCELEVRVRQTLAADGTTSSHSTVHCPRQARTVRVRECVDCNEYVGLSFDREEQTIDRLVKDFSRDLVAAMMEAF